MKCKAGQDDTLFVTSMGINYCWNLQAVTLLRMNVLMGPDMKYYPLKTAVNLWLRITVSTQQPAMELNPSWRLLNYRCLFVPFMFCV